MHFTNFITHRHLILAKHILDILRECDVEDNRNRIPAEVID